MSLLNDMLALLTNAYASKPTSNTGKLFAVLSESLDALSGTLSKVADWCDLQQAAGTTLDRLGGNCGVARSGLDDPTYRLMIAIKMMARISAGDGDTMIRSTAALLGVEDTAVSMTEGDASVTMLADELDVPVAFFQRAELVSALLQEIAAAGIQVILELQRPAYDTIYVGFGLQLYDNMTIRQVN